MRLRLSKDRFWTLGDDKHYTAQQVLTTVQTYARIYFPPLSQPPVLYGINS